MALGFELLTAESHGDAGTNVVSERYGAKELCSADAPLLTSGECGWHNGATRVGLRRRVGIVSLVGMSQHAVGESRFDRAARDI